MNVTTPTQRSSTVPTLIVRLLQSPSKQRSNISGPDTLGKIATKLIPITLTNAPLPEGPILETRLIQDYAICSDPDRLYTTLLGSVISLEVYHATGTRRIRQVLFRGGLLTEEKQFTATENAVNLTWATTVLLDAEPIEMILSYQSIGVVLQRLNAGDYWPVDAIGNKIGGIDSKLYNLIQWTGLGELAGVPLPQAFADILQPRKGLIPVVTYDSNGKIILTARERGQKRLDLIVPSIKDQTGSRLYKTEIKDLRGSIDYGRVVNRITGYGGMKRRADIATLTPAWDRSLDQYVKTDPSLLQRDDRFREVGRLYRFDGDFWPLNAEGSGYTAQREDPIIWGRREVGRPWVKMNVSAGFTMVVEPGQLGLLSRKSQAGFLSGDYKYILFKSPMVTRYYTESQRIAREQGEPTPATVDFWELELQAIKQNGLLQTDTGVLGDLPIYRRRIHRNRDYSALTAGSFFREATDGRTAATPDGLFDNTSALQQEVFEKIIISRNPRNSFTISMPYCAFHLEHGMTYERMIDDRGRTIFDDLDYTIEGPITYNLRVNDNSAFTTQISLDGDSVNLLGGLTL